MAVRLGPAPPNVWGSMNTGELKIDSACPVPAKSSAPGIQKDQLKQNVSEKYSANGCLSSANSNCVLQVTHEHYSRSLDGRLPQPRSSAAPAPCSTGTPPSFVHHQQTSS